MSGRFSFEAALHKITKCVRREQWNRITAMHRDMSMRILRKKERNIHTAIPIQEKTELFIHTFIRIFQKMERRQYTVIPMRTPMRIPRRF